MLLCFSTIKPDVYYYLINSFSKSEYRLVPMLKRCKTGEKNRII